MLSVVEAWRRTRALRRRKGRLPSGKWWRRLRVISSPTHFVKNIQEHVNNFTFAWWGDFEQQSCLCAYHGSLQIVKMGRAVGLINVWSGSRGTTRSSDAQTGRLPPGLAGAEDFQTQKTGKVWWCGPPPVNAGTPSPTSPPNGCPASAQTLPFQLSSPSYDTHWPTSFSPKQCGV